MHTARSACARQGASRSAVEYTATASSFAAPAGAEYPRRNLAAIGDEHALHGFSDGRIRITEFLQGAGERITDPSRLLTARTGSLATGCGGAAADLVNADLEER